ncbi:RES family NAD+ phosphorylase [Cedecea davisae]|uniref:RES family NAD+ phosphorylase n=1 Tax=Cedecea davisae TaxID=158484 RepID=UPI001D0A54F8|nr:RES family NAD+ phosphorylase [Cedecea davisae]
MGLSEKDIQARREKEKAVFGTPAALLPELPEPGEGISVFKENLAAGTVLYRCHAMQWAGNSFNPGRELGENDYGARFSPFKDELGMQVPSLYVADSLSGALAETLFHDLIGGERRGFLSIRPWLTWGMSELVSKRDLVLATLKTADLYRMGLTKQLFLLSDRPAYLQTQRWAKAIYHQNHDIDGMVWKSRQHDDSSAFILFGNRLNTADLELQGKTRSIFTEPTVVNEVMRMAARLGVVLSDE